MTRTYKITMLLLVLMVLIAIWAVDAQIESRIVATGWVTVIIAVIIGSAKKEIISWEFESYDSDEESESPIESQIHYSEKPFHTHSVKNKFISYD